MRKVLDVIWGEWEQKYFSENQKKDSTALSTKRPTGKSADRAVQPAAWKFQVFFSLCKAALQVTAPFRLADRVEQCALSEAKPTLLQVTGLQRLTHNRHRSRGPMLHEKAQNLFLLRLRFSGS
jgi:hypothetical protein